MKNLRLNELQLRDIQRRSEQRGSVRTHLLDGESAPKLIIQVLLHDIKTAGLPEPVLEHRFHDVRKWRFDLAYISEMVAIEVEGGIWVQGRHNRGAGMEADICKYNEAQLMGWTVLRYSTEQIKNGLPIQDLKRALKGEVA